MALTYEIVTAEANSIKSVCDEVAALLARVQMTLEHNSDLSINWAAAETPAYITEDGSGNLSGLPYSRQDVSNAVGSLDWVRKLLTNQSMADSQGDHLGNINKLASATQWRVRVGN